MLGGTSGPTLGDVLRQGVSGEGTHAWFLASEDLFLGTVARFVWGGVVRGQNAVENFRPVSFRGGYQFPDSSIHTLSGGFCEAIAL